MSGATPVPRLDDRYELADRTGHTLGAIPFATLQNMVRQGRLFRTDKVTKNAGEITRLGDLPEFTALFDELLPEAFKVDGAALRPAPELAGEVDTLALAGLFGRLYRKRSTGRLFVREGEQEKVVIFRQGVPVNAMSNIQEEWLGEVLISQGLIDAEAFAQAAELRRQNGSRIGSALVFLEKLSPRELQRALSVQAMERLLNVFRLEHGTFQFIPDDTAAHEDILLMAAPRDIIETGLATALSPQQVTAALNDYGDPTLEVDVPPELDAEVGSADRAVLEVLASGRPLSACLPDIARLARLTTAEARTRVLALMKFGLVRAGDEDLRELDAVLERLQATDFFTMLDVRRAASPEDVQTAFERKVIDFAARTEEGDSAVVAHARKKIRAVLDWALRTLRDEKERALYERALQLGLDFEQPEVRRRVEFEYHMNLGRSLLAQQRYQEAHAAYMQAIQLMPENPDVLVQLGWSQFLASPRDGHAAHAAIEVVNRALKQSGDLDTAYLAIGKVHRLVGDRRAAEDNLRRAIELNRNNLEAQSELRLLFSRELDQAPKISLQAGSTLVKVSLYLVAVCGLLYAGANVMGGGATKWPTMIDKALQEKAKESPDDPNVSYQMSISEAARKRLQPEVSDDVPADQQVMGNVEFHYLVDDAFWWIRRGLLLVLGVLGVLFVSRQRDVKILGARPVWIAVGIPYGVMVGFLSAGPPTPTPLGPLLGMTAFHVVAEQAFFFVFLGRALIKEMEEPLNGVGVTALIFGLYHLTFFATLALPGPQMIQGVLMVGAFAGGAYGMLLWRSGGILAPLLCHLAVNVTFMVRSVLAQAG